MLVPRNTEKIGPIYLTTPAVQEVSTNKETSDCDNFRKVALCKRGVTCLVTYPAISPTHGTLAKYHEDLECHGHHHHVAQKEQWPSSASMQAAMAPYPFREIKKPPKRTK